MSTRISTTADGDEPFLLSTNESDESQEEELARLTELQRRQTEMLRPDIDNFVADDDHSDADDDFSVTAAHNNNDQLRTKRVPVPEMRFAKQFENSVNALQAKGASSLAIFWSAILIDQIVMPFVSGFGFCMASAGWRWYRARGVINARQPRKGGLFRNIKDWTR
ncbi:hypothetical protein BDF20DRAFT_834031 [Mycotypha africana]|uniref:uncharacterized protein n=1 Tax=Mycotypha africana TaxID=64632 RepID=UPI00230170BF|nr:uncharacterized protein BDF20DRAFT_834031 [Mycotypha africana]KAI8984530.1 hypothetical protein BDF20DRAFT_834031 [Mycotypha africana]